MSLGKKVLIGVGAIVGLLVVVIIAVVSTTGKERDLATEFVADISNNRIGEAYSQYSDALKDVQDQETLAAQVDTLKLDSSCKLEISGLESGTSTDFGTVKKITGKVKCDSKTIDSAEFTYNGDGKLVGFGIEQASIESYRILKRPAIGRFNIN